MATTVVDILDTLTEWAKVEICSQIQLKKPPEDERDSNAAAYDYQLIMPACFPIFVPSKDKLPPNVLSPIPSLCVRILEGTDDLRENSRGTTVEFSFSTWSTGTHGKDLFHPEPLDKAKWKQWTGEEAEAYFQRNSEGWRDVWNWIDIALRAIESTATIHGIQIERNAGIKFYLYKEQGIILDYYPFWYAGIQFVVKTPLIRNIKDYEDFL